jgi:hypothetical protein
MGSSVVLQTFRGLEASSLDGDSDTKCMILNINLNIQFFPITDHSPPSEKNNLHILTN